jgi:hypothetical protein
VVRISINRLQNVAAPAQCKPDFRSAILPDRFVSKIRRRAATSKGI